MTLSPVAVESFGGLNLQSDAGETGWNGAIDCLNVDFDQRGRVRSRDGYTQLKASAGGLDALGTWGTNGDILAAASTVRAINNAGTTTATSAALSTSLYSFAEMGGTAGTDYTYAGIGDAGGHILRWDGTTFTYPNVGYSGRFAAVTPWDNRLVLGYMTFPASSTALSLLRFSDAGTPETFGANNFIYLRPGDGEPIAGMCTWRNELYVFKNTIAYVFYGTSTDASGNPIFNYRTIDTGHGVGQRGIATPSACVAMDDGVYFVNQEGVYRTQGGTPEKVSRAIDPIFRIGSAPFYTGGTTSDFDSPVLGRFQHRLYVGFFTSLTTYATLVYDTLTGTWSYWNIPMRLFATVNTSTGAAPVLQFANNAGAILRVGGSTDIAAAITSSYRSGFSDLGTPDMKRMWGWRLQGSGAPTLKLSSDFGALETGAAVTLGTSPALAEGIRRYAPRGRQFSWQLGATTAWSVNSLVASVAGKRAVGEHATA